MSAIGKAANINNTPREGNPCDGVRGAMTPKAETINATAQSPTASPGRLRCDETIAVSLDDSCGIITASNDEVERRGVALPTNEADLSRSSIPSLAQRRRGPVIARTDC